MLIFDKQRESYQIVGYKQFDSLEPLNAQFLNNGIPINLAEYNIRLECKKPDGNIIIQDTDITVKNICEIEMFLNEQVTVVNGNVKCQFVLVNKLNEKQTSTFTFELDVQQSVININGYSSSLITVAERLNTNIIIGGNVDKSLNTTITNANLVKQELIDKTNIANATTDTLVEKTNLAVATTDTLVEKTKEATQKKQQLDTSITSAVEKDGTLTRTTALADTTNVALQQSLSQAQGSISLLVGAGNKNKIILSTDWSGVEGGYTYNWLHGLNTDNIIVSFEDFATQEPILPNYKKADKNNILLKSDTKKDIKVILNASYYSGGIDAKQEIIDARFDSYSGYQHENLGSRLDVMTDDVANSINRSEIVNNLTAGGVSKVLSAEQGKVLGTQLGQIRNNIPSFSIPNYAKFDMVNVKRGYEISLYGGLLQLTGKNYSDAVIDEFMLIDPSSKYEVLVYQAEDIYITEYSGTVFIGQTRLANGYRWVYDGSYNLIDYGATSVYASQSAFSYFETKVGTNRIKVSFKFSESSTSPLYYPNSNTLMLDNAINSLKIVKVSEKGV